MTRKHTHEDPDDDGQQVSMFDSIGDDSQYQGYWERKNAKPTTGIACDASCVESNGSKEKDGYHHGIVEWQAKDLTTGETILRSVRYEEGNSNLGEFLAIIGTLRYLKEKGDRYTSVYSDSEIAISWVGRKLIKSTLPENEFTWPILDDTKEALNWLRSNKIHNKVHKWRTRIWGENPADFGRK